MKLQSLTPFLTVTARACGIASLTVLDVTATFNQPSYAQSTTFYCGTSGNVPTTLARTPSGDTKEVIRWVSPHFSGSGYNPQTRCEQVSGRFQSNYNKGHLDFITAGYLNGLPAICAGDGTSPCSSDRLLFTLKPGEDAAREIQQLFNIKTGQAGPLYESTRGSSSGSSTIDMKAFLESAPVVDAGTSTPNAQPTTTTPNKRRPSVEPGGGMTW